jgi:hypothetical protein
MGTRPPRLRQDGAFSRGPLYVRVRLRRLFLYLHKPGFTPPYRGVSEHTAIRGVRANARVEVCEPSPSPGVHGGPTAAVSEHTSSRTSSRLSIIECARSREHRTACTTGRCTSRFRCVPGRSSEASASWCRASRQPTQEIRRSPGRCCTCTL